ncbi:MAG: TetR family transcriptional regulator, partial [Pseudomonadota bacterium]
MTKPPAKVAKAAKATAPVQNKRDTVLAAALALFSRFGLHGTSVDQVAARAGV